MPHKHILNQTFKAWLPLAAGIVIMSGLVYGAVQQNYRQNANDPQIQIAQDIAAAITQGAPASSIVPPTGTTEVNDTLSPFVMIFDDSGKLIGSSAILDGKNPNYPKSVLDAVKKSGRDARVTWQPKAGVRMATVVTRFTGKDSGYIVAGRSLKEVENRISQLTLMTAMATALALVVTLLVMFFLQKTGHGHIKTETTIEITEEKVSE